MEHRNKYTIFAVALVLALGMIFLMVLLTAKDNVTGFFAKSPDSTSYRETEISLESANDVWGSIVSDDLILLIRQEGGVRHIRGFNSSVILHNISDGKEQVIFESGKFGGLNDSEKKMVINGVPSMSPDFKTVNVPVIESGSLEFMPLNAMYNARTILPDMSVSFEERSGGHGTILADSGELKVDEFTSRRMPISDSLDMTIEQNYTANTQAMFAAKKNGTDKKFLGSMTPSKPFFIKNRTVLFENGKKIMFMDIETGSEYIVYDASNRISYVKGIYGLNEDKNILMSSAEDNFFLYDPFSRSWRLVSASGADYSLNAPVYNGQGKIIDGNADRILLQKIDKGTGDSRLYLYVKPGRLAVFAAGNQIPLLGSPTAQGARAELKFGNRKGNIAPDFNLTTIDGRELSLPEIKASGKSVVLYAWATWCPSCAKEFPGINAEFSRAKYPNVEFIAVNIDLTEGNEIIRQYKEKKGLDNLEFARATERFLLDYKIRSTTTKFVIGSDGIILYTGSGVLGQEDWAKILGMADKSGKTRDLTKYAYR